MSGATSNGDLRTRMLRVATKPRAGGGTPGTGASPRVDHLSPVDARRPRPGDVDLTSGRRVAPSPRPAPATLAGRIHTLLAWVRWELTSVPSHRWGWLKAVVFGGPIAGSVRRRSR